MDNFHHLLLPQPGWTRQASSFGRDPERGNDWGGMRHKEARVKRIAASAQQLGYALVSVNV